MAQRTQVLAASMAAFQRRLAKHVKATGKPGPARREDLPPGMQRELEEVGLWCHSDCFAGPPSLYVFVVDAVSQ